MANKPFKPALIIVDFQEDFCPPNGSLAVPDGRAIAPTVNTLLTLPFTLKLATKDWHPRDHISFAANHPAPNNKPYESTTTITHPRDAERSYTSLLWPVHCVQDTPGAALVPELHADRLDDVIDKGMTRDVEMYSAFYDPLRVCDSGLAGRLKGAGITHVFVVGLAADFCVKSTAESAVEEGFETFIVEQGTRAVMLDKWDECKKEIEGKGIKFVSEDGPEIANVKAS